MRRSVVVSLGLLVALYIGACATQEPGTLQAATAALGASELKSIEYSGTGKWFQFGQAPNPTLPWPAVRRQQLHRERQLRDAGRARADEAHPGRRARSRASGAGPAASGADRQRHARVEHGAAGRRRARHARPRRSRSRQRSRSGRWRSGRRRMDS